MTVMTNFNWNKAIRELYIPCDLCGIAILDDEPSVIHDKERVHMHCAAEAIKIDTLFGSD